MKLLIVHHFPGVGGGTISALDVAKMLRMMGHEVKLAIPSPCDMVIQSCNELGVHIRNIIPPPLFTYHNASSNAIKCIVKYTISKRNCHYWKKFLQEEKPDVVVLNSVAQAPLINIINALGIKSIITIRETFRLNGSKLTNLYLRHMISKADAALYLTEFDKKQWKTNNRITGVLPDIVDELRFVQHSKEEEYTFKKTYSISENVNYILYLGGISSVKGALDLLLAFELLANKRADVGLILLGNIHKEVSSHTYKILNRKEYNYQKKCHYIIDRLLRKKVALKIVGTVSDPSFWYESSSVVVFPVTSVHQPRPAYEAGYYKKPIILPDYKNYEDYLVEGYNGHYYKHGNYKDLAAKIEKTISSENYAILGVNNFDSYFKTHSLNVAKTILCNILKDF